MQVFDIEMAVESLSLSSAFTKIYFGILLILRVQNFIQNKDGEKNFDKIFKYRCIVQILIELLMI